ncbi:DUF7524 family protein [Haloarcula marina]|uniref:DUF7524 family protein n=1 Tax=Haloarcula marina TaxID=2961574 RepID=UPI0020B6C87D|nr:hypothetical protein [Halomicroarcula marina]
MPESLPVHVNRTTLHGLEVPKSFETSESFEIRIVNHGEPTHVHLHVDDALSELAAIDATNHYVKRGSERRVRVTLTKDGATRGNLKVATAHGATTRYVEVVVTESEAETQGVVVDEDLAKPRPKSEAVESEDFSGRFERSIPVIVGTSLALGAAVTATIVFGTDFVALAAGVVAVLAFAIAFVIAFVVLTD